MKPLVIVAALALLVPACSADDDPTPSAPAVTTAPTTSPSPKAAADRAAGSAGSSAAATTSTAPVLVAVGDIACDPAATPTATTCQMAATARTAAALEPDVVAALGDTQYPAGSAEGYANSYDKSWGALKAITRPAVGNHEYGTAGAAPYFDYFGAAAGNRTKGYYSYDVGAWHVVVLNSNCTIVSCKADSAQLQWLAKDLAANPSKCSLAYWHHPRFSSGKHGSNLATDALWRAVDKYGVDVVLSGHDHSYERFRRMRASGAYHENAPRGFVVGTGGVGLYPFGTVVTGSQVRANKTFGVLKLTLKPTSYDFRFVRSTGAAFTDSGSTRCR